MSVGRPGGLAGRLRAQLDEIGDDPRGWNGAAGRECVELIRAECRREAGRWTNVAGHLEDEGMASAWIELEAWRVRRPDHDPLGVLRTTIRRAYVAEAGAVQTGMGDAVRDRKKVSRTLASAREAGHGRSLRAEVDLTLRPSEDAGEDSPPPRWAKLLARLLVQAGWSWPAPAGQCVLAAAMHGSRGRREGVDPQWERSGVPAATWSALVLLVGGSGPGCALESRWPGARAIHDVGGVRAVVESAEVQRIVAAAVAGRPVRSGRIAVRPRGAVAAEAGAA